MPLPDYPISTQWVTFPTDIKSTVVIGWTESKLDRRQASYYKARCYWGELSTNLENERENDKPDNTKPVVLPTKAADINIVGATTIYIAQEYAEKGYAGGAVKKFHIQDLARAANGGSEVPPWITMRLDAHFHYGQDGKDGKLRRWIVYHPSIVKGVATPAMHQHRFTGLPKTEWLKSVAADASEIASNANAGAHTGAFLGSKVGGKVIDLLESKFGDPLHQFLDQHAAYTVMHADTEKLKLVGDNQNLPLRTRRLIAVQVFELQKIILEMKKADTTNVEIEKEERQFHRWAQDFFLNHKDELIKLHQTLATSAELDSEAKAQEDARRASFKAVEVDLNSPVHVLAREVSTVVNLNNGVPELAAQLIKTYQKNPLVAILNNPQGYGAGLNSNYRDNALLNQSNLLKQGKSVKQSNNQSNQRNNPLSQDTDQIDQGSNKLGDYSLSSLARSEQDSQGSRSLMNRNFMPPLNKKK